MNFKIEQIAIILPTINKGGKELLAAIGLNEWTRDIVIADGTVKGIPALNKAELNFNYQVGENLEFELLEYTVGDNWRSGHSGVSHFGMHVTAGELEVWRALFDSHKVPVVQEVKTVSHTNPKIKDSRRYHYVIFGTRPMIGVDLKFIVRLNLDGTPFAGE